MPIQIAVPASDDIVCERRREAVERDASIYAASAEPGDLDGLAVWAAAQPMDID